MEIDVRNYGRYKVVKLTNYGTTFESRFLDEDEANDLAVELINAAYDLFYGSSEEKAQSVREILNDNPL